MAVQDNIRSTSLRFNLDKPDHSKAWEHLQKMNKSDYKSYTQAIVVSVSDYFERHYIRQSDPYFENREREEQFISQIICEVEKSLANSVPHFLTACLAGFKVLPSANVTEIPPKVTDDTTNDYIDLDFVGG